MGIVMILLLCTESEQMEEYNLSACGYLGWPNGGLC